MYRTPQERICAATLLAFLSLLVNDSLVVAVNSPQMTFFTPPSHETMVHLESKYGYSATLKLRRPRPFAPSSPYSFSWATSEGNQVKRKLTEFVVLGPDYPFHGVSAVIQEMNLRTTPDGGCRDFVQFAVNASESSRSQQICGHIAKEDNWKDGNSDPRLQRSYFNPDGALYLYFYSDQIIRDSQENQDGLLEEEEIGIEIVFTSYTVCPNPANSWKKLQACSTTDQMSCIYSTLFCDSKIDCGFPGEFGVDEEGCYFPYIYVTLSILAAVLLTATLIYMFVRWVTKVPKEYR